MFVPARGKRPVPVVCHFMYTTLASHIRNSRIRRAQRNADLVLLDYDDPAKFADAGLPVERCAYSVNERLYRDRGLKREVDVGFYCVWRMAPERRALHGWLTDFCKKKGYVYRGSHRFVKGYPELLAGAKVIVHLNRTPTTRPARIFDVAASRTALLSNPMPEVSGERWKPWKHYVPFEKPTGHYVEKRRSAAPPYTDKDCAEIIKGLEWLLDEGHWGEVAQRAHEYVLANHTWAVRARQLRATFLDIFPELRKKMGES